MGALGGDASARRRNGETGTSEAHWAAALASVPALGLDELVPPTSRLVIVAPHPDDEVLACGGLLAAHARRGGRTAVIAVTDGEASHRGKAHWPEAALAETRRRESDGGLRLLGVPPAAITRLGLPDGGMPGCTEPLRESLEALLQRGDVVVTTWQLDGHPDHEAVGSTAQAVCTARGAVCLQAPVWMWHWSHAGDERMPWPQLRAFALADELLAQKRAALAMHATQLAPRGEGEGPVLGPLILERAARRAEYFFVAE